MKRSNRLLWLLAVALLAACPAQQPAPAPPLAPASTVARSRSSQVGTVVGRAAVVGALPALPGQPIPSGLSAQCGQSVPDLTVQLGDGGALANAVVFVADALPEPLPAGLPAPFIDQHRCAYSPPVLATRVGAVLKVKNSDPLIHNVRVDGLFNVAMPLEGQIISKPLPALQGPLTLHCDVHPWMRADVYAFAHSHYAVTGPDGRFRLEGVEVGSRPLTVWHPRFGEHSFTVTVSAGAEVTADPQFEASALLPR